MPRPTIVLVAVLVVAAGTPCEGAMATSAALIPDVPDHVVAAIAAGLEGVVRATRRWA